MDNLFRNRALAGAVNRITTPEARIFNRLFAPRASMQITDRLAFDVITGSERLLPNISVSAPATVTAKTGRQTVTVTAPRLAQKRFIAASDLNAVRAYGQQFAAMTIADRIAQEQMDMRGEIDRTIEHWAAGALRGKVYDADGTTVLVDYGLATTHDITLTSTDLWTDTDDGDPLGDLRAWKRRIEDDGGAAITEWVAFLGGAAMDALLASDSVRELLRYGSGAALAATGRVASMAEVELNEYNGSYLDAAGTRTRFVATNEVILIGMCADVVACPYAPVVDLGAGGGATPENMEGGTPVMYAAKSWEEQDPSGRWLKIETRPLPVLQRPGCVVRATVA